MGSSACSMRSRMAGLFSVCCCCCCPPRARRRAPSTELGLNAAAPKAKTAPTTVTNTTTTKIRGNMNLPAHLNLDPYDFADHKISNCLQRDSGDQQGVSNRVRKQRLNEAGIEHQHDRNNNRRHAHQKRHRESALGGVDAHLTLDLKALADDVRQIVENFSEVAAGFALQHDGSDEELYVDQGHAVREIDESVAHRHAKFLLFVELPELAGDGLGHFVGNHFDGGREGVSGANRARQGVDRLGEEFLKFLEALVAPVR